MSDGKVTGFSFTSKEEVRGAGKKAQTERTGTYQGNSCTVQAFNCSLNNHSLNDALNDFCTNGFQAADTSGKFVYGKSLETFYPATTIACGGEYVPKGTFEHEDAVNATNNKNQGLLVVSENPNDIHIKAMKTTFDEHLQTPTENIMEILPTDTAWNTAIDQMKAKVGEGGTITIALSAESDWKGDKLYDKAGNNLKDSEMARRIAELKKEGYNVCVIDTGCFGERRQGTLIK